MNENDFSKSGSVQYSTNFKKNIKKTVKKL